MLKRKIYDKLLEWKSITDHKCLLVKGQRQIGKTFIISRFAEENYEHRVYMDLSEQKTLHQAFEGGLDVNTMIKALKLYLDPDEFVPGKTLIFIDEIQACPRAREASKSFSIDERTLHSVQKIRRQPVLDNKNRNWKPLLSTRISEHASDRTTRYGTVQDLHVRYRDASPYDGCQRTLSDL